jgi:hypothetical protein
MRWANAWSALTLVLALALPSSVHAGAAMAQSEKASFRVTQAMVPATGMTDVTHPMPMEQRFLDRFPQPAQVGSLVGLPVLDLRTSTIGYVRHVVRTPQGKIELIVSYSRWWGWFGRPVAVPIEAVGIEGRQLVSLDMPPSQYAAAPTWHHTNEAILPAEATIRVALART